MLEIEGINEIGIFSGNNAVVCISKLHNLIVIRTIAMRQIQRMNGRMAILVQQMGKASWKLGVDEEVHPATATIRLICANFAA